MAQLKDLIVNGASRLIGDVFTNKIQITAVNAPTASNGTTYGPGTNGQVLKSNGTSVYWAADDNSQTVTGVKGNSESSYRTGNVNITAANIGLGNVENTKLSTWTGSTNITTLGTISSGTVPWARLSNVPAGANKEGTVTKVTAGTGLSIGTTAQGNFTTTGTINHTNSVTAQTTQALYPIKIDACGHISAYGTAVVPLTASSTLDATKLSGTIPSSCYTNTTYTFDGTYNSSTNKAATVSTVTNAINNLDVSNISGFGAGKTLATLTETDGKIAATFQNISITTSQISDMPTVPTIQIVRW